MKHSTNNTNQTLLAAILLAAIAALALACEPDFEDGSMALLKKPEILSVVLEPPEAAPGEQVNASFLIADGKGVIEGKAALWMPMTEGQTDEAFMAETLAAMALELDDLAAPTLDFTVPPAELFGFDDDGFGGLPLSLVAAHGDDPAPGTTAMELLGGLEQHIECLAR